MNSVTPVSAEDQKLIDAYLESEREPAWVVRLGCFAFIATMSGVGVALYVGRPILAIALFASMCVCARAGELFVEYRQSVSRLGDELFDRGLQTYCLFNYLARRVRTEVDRGACSEYIIVLQGAALPHGGGIKVFCLLDATTAEGRMMVNHLVIPMDRVAFTRIAHLATQFLHDPRTASRFPVADGFPCDVLVGSHGTRQVARAVCNLRDPDPSLPVHKLARAIVDLTSPHAGASMVTGSVDGFGKITIGDP